MPPKIHLVRHAQGYHNLGIEHMNIHDPLLTDYGKKQCHELRRNFPNLSGIELLVASPMRRAIYTALEAFLPDYEKPDGRKLIALPELQELSDMPCDVGSSLADLKAEMEAQGAPVDLSGLDENWTEKTGRLGITIERIFERAQYVRQWLMARPEKEIVVVSHGGFLHFLTEDWEEGCKGEGTIHKPVNQNSAQKLDLVGSFQSNQYVTGTGWVNTEFRTYEFGSMANGHAQKCHEGTNDISLKETVESRRRRDKPDPSPTREQQKELCEQVLDGWAKQGYPIPSENDR
ncbi:phosphoglycerate mutase-like protein [Penicillium atrosanguineum]|uniref:Phosphoglycerate mutase-like protein n=1 Tax=Penicillium atrosanguineum TaxID=1132637 RepID=A0A9W9QFD7_9EURO|nr:phosphoglycerate mutase-like protein [Penicillium atrosanguineum]KAJ5331178.1 phosphoglycerate mutase-like protein [Penicillium atrosanguineum]